MTTRVPGSITSRVIDQTRPRCLAEVMTSSFDRTVRAVMWMDAFLSVAMVAVCVVAAPVVATLPVPAGVQLALGGDRHRAAVLLAAFGAITAVLLMLRMRSGQYFLPALRLPLPDGMRPEIGMPPPTRAADLRGHCPRDRRRPICPRGPLRRAQLRRMTDPPPGSRSDRRWHVRTRRPGCDELCSQWSGPKAWAVGTPAAPRPPLPVATAALLVVVAGPQPARPVADRRHRRGFRP